jgi:hypothetical protein
MSAYHRLKADKQEVAKRRAARDSVRCSAGKPQCCTRVKKLFKTAVPITTFVVVILIPKPPGREPLFGSRATILFGAFDKEGMRRWQKRVRAARNSGEQLNAPSEEPGNATPDERDGSDN